MEIRKSNELQIGKAGEYLVCADLCMKGLVAFLSEQGLPYDVLIDVNGKLLKCQVKTTEKPRAIPQRHKNTEAYIFNIKRKGRDGKQVYNTNEVDVFALVSLDTKAVGYVLNKDMPGTLNIRIDSARGTYHDEKGLADYYNVIELNKTIKNQSEIARKLKINVATINRMLSKGYEPFKTNAKYFSDYFRSVEWFLNI